MVFAISVSAYADGPAVGWAMECMLRAVGQRGAGFARRDGAVARRVLSNESSEVGTAHLCRSDDLSQAPPELARRGLFARQSRTAVYAERRQSGAEYFFSHKAQTRAGGWHAGRTGPTLIVGRGAGAGGTRLAYPP